MSGFCVDCGFKVSSFDGLEACPQCGSTGIPCSDDDQVTISINWHELRILGIWAENYANRCDDKAAQMRATVFSIAGRIEKQFPDRTPITLAGEVSQLREAFDIETNIPGAEE